MIYVEFIHWDRAMPIEIFRHLGRQSSGWKEDSADRLVLQIGRTLRLGPMPSYLAFWEIPNIDRLDDWEVYFRSAEAIANRRSQAMHKAISIERAGLYDSLFAGDSKDYPLYYVEYYRHFASEGAAKLAHGLDEDGLLHVLQRVGYLGPEPEGIAIWGCHSYQRAETVSRQSQLRLPTPMDAGVYRKFGDEAL